MTAFKKILRWLGAALLGTLLLLSLVYAALLFINRNDVPPSPLVQKAAAELAARKPVPAERNAYITMMGLGTGPCQDAFLAGQSRIARLAKELEAGKTWDMEWLSEEKADSSCSRCEQPDPEVAALKERCKSPGQNCLVLTSRDWPAAEKWLKDEYWRIARYQRLLGQDAWQQTLPFTLYMPMPAFGQASDDQAIYLMEALSRARQGQTENVREMLSDDLRFWRTMLRDADSLIIKMMATSAIRRHFIWGNTLIRELPPERQKEALPPEWQQAFTAQEKSLSWVFLHEWDFGNNMLQMMREQSFLSSLDFQDINMAMMTTVNALQLPLTQSQALSNDHLALMTDIANTLDVDYPDLPAALIKAENLEDAYSNTPLLAKPYGYNIGGRLYAQWGAQWSLYGARAADMEGVRRLAVLATELRAVGTPRDYIAAALETASLRNPYDNQPFAWDAENRALVFRGLGVHARTKDHSLIY